MGQYASQFLGGVRSGMSVLQPWVEELPLREQGTLLTGMRGCDLAPKNPICIDEAHGCSTGEDTAERALTAFLRFCVMNPVDLREVDVVGAFFRSTPPPDWKPSQFGHYPLHWYSHLMHCFEVVGYRRPHGRGIIGMRRLESFRPDPIEDGFEPYSACPGTAVATEGDCLRCDAYRIYERMARSLHLNIETRDEMIARLSEDRIALGEIVS